MQYAKVKATTLLTWLLAMFFVCCGEKHTVGKELVDIEDYMEAHPDSTKQMVEKLNGFYSTHEGLGETEKMKLELLCADAQNKAYVAFATDTTMKAVVNYFDSCGTLHEKIKAHYLLGCVYRDMGETTKAMGCLLDAVKIFSNDNNPKTSEYLTISKVYSQKADIEYRTLLARDMLKSLDKGMHYAFLGKDTLAALRIGCHKAFAYYILDEFDSAFACNKYFAQQFVEHGRPQEAAMMAGADMAGLLEMGDYEKMKRAIDHYEAYSGNVVGGKAVPGTEIYYYYMGEYMLWHGNCDSALYYFRKEQQYGKDIHNQYSAACGLAKLYDKLGMADSAAKYSMLYSSLSDTMDAHSDVGELHNLLMQRQSKRKDIEHQKNIHGWFLFAGCFLLIVSVASLLYWKKNTKSKKYTKHAYDDALDGMRTDMKVLQDRCSEAEEKVYVYERKCNEALSQIYTSELFAGLKNALADGRFLVSNEAHDIQVLVEKVLPGFRAKVNPLGKLSDAEYMICILTKLNVKPSDIAKLLGFTKSDVSKKRKRLLAKIFGIDGKPSDFDDAIKKF